MNLEVAGVAERLVHEFPEVPATVVIEAVCDCADDCTSAGPFFIEQAVRARLCALTHRLEALAAEPVVIPAQPVRAPEQLGVVLAGESGHLSADARVCRDHPGPVLPPT
jgi:hypothetical protein